MSLAGKMPFVENNMAKGIVFKSATSGLWYENKNSAGEVEAVRVDGVLFEKVKVLKYGASRFDKHGGY